MLLLLLQGLALSATATPVGGGVPRPPVPSPVPPLPGRAPARREKPARRSGGSPPAPPGSPPVPLTPETETALEMVDRRVRGARKAASLGGSDTCPGALLLLPPSLLPPQPPVGDACSALKRAGFRAAHCDMAAQV